MKTPSVTHDVLDMLERRSATPALVIDPDKLARIFEPFFTTKDVNKGTGLGLSQAYGFAKHSGGDIAVESKLNHGTSFSLYLRCAGSGAGDDVVARTQINPAAVHCERRILLVEDNETVGRFAVSALNELAQTVVWAPHAAAALERLDQGETFELVFSDVVMPGMSGIAFARIIPSKWPALPVILTSGYSHVLAEAGVQDFDFVNKPYSMESLAVLLSWRGSPRPRWVVRNSGYPASNRRSRCR